MVKDSITRGYIVGFTDLGNTDEFSTEMLAWRLGHVGLDLFLQAVCFPCYGCVFDIDVTFPPQAEVINYKGDLNTPPDQVAPSQAELRDQYSVFNQAERKKKTNFVGKKMRMGKGKGGGDESSDENDW